LFAKQKREKRVRRAAVRGGAWERYVWKLPGLSQIPASLFLPPLFDVHGCHEKEVFYIHHKRTVLPLTW
jgi:hypothetical protein